MSEVTLEIGGRAYTVACEEGQESHIEMLGGMIEEKLASMGQLAPSRSQNLLFAGLFLADDLHESKNASGSTDGLNRELEALRETQAKSVSDLQELQLERDAWLSERDTMRNDHETLKSELAAAQAERDAVSSKISEMTAQVEQMSLTQSSEPAAPDIAPQLEDIATALEKCATKLEQRVTDA